MKAFYYSGIKPKPIEVDVYFESSGLVINYLIGKQLQTVEWLTKNIKPDDNPSDGKVILSYGHTAPFEYLEFHSSEIFEILHRNYPNHTWNAKGNWLNQYALAVIVTVIVIVIAALFGLYFLLAPKLADGLSSKVPVQWEVELGNKMITSFNSGDKKNEVKSAQLDSFFKLMRISSEYPIRIHYVEDSVINAFAIPGGHIVVYQGLLKKMNSYESLAGLLAHEFSHISQKHSLKTIFRSLSSYLIFATVFGDMTGLAGIILENSNSIQNLSYSRKFEHEADEFAANILIDRKIGLIGMLDLFKVFLAIGKAGLSLPEFLSTHPLTEERIKYIESRMSKNEEEPVEHQELKQLFLRLKS